MMSYRRLSAVVLSSIVVAGCAPTKPIDPPKPNYADLGPKEVPDFLQRTIWQQVDLANASPLRVAGFGLVVNLDGTGDTRAPNPVREFMLKQMQKHGFGSSMTGMSTLAPEQVLSDPDKRTAIVRVEGFIPPGAHKGQRFDVRVAALENSNTSSLHRGELYETDLAPRGDDMFNPGGGLVNPLAVVKSGPIAINPAYALDSESPGLNQKLSMKYGVVMNQGVVADERPLVLKLRQPERRLAKMIEARINERFQDAAGERFNADTAENSPDAEMYQRRGNVGSKVAVAKDEGEVWLYVPYQYRDDWERFVGVVMHLYFSSNADFAVLQARALADIAKKDGDQAPLLDISYCWEALGEQALPAVTPLYTHSVPAVAFAAARAGAFVGDLGAQEALARMAKTPEHPFQVSAVEVLGAIPSTAGLRSTLRGLLDSDQLLVRLAAYKAMVKNRDSMIVSTYLKTGKFTLDLITSNAPPLVYATRVGEPRIAIIGRPPTMEAPALLMTMNNRLSVMADAEQRGARIYYRPKFAPAVEQSCKNDLSVLIARFGGETPDPRDRIRMSYTDVVGIVQKLCDDKLVAAVGPTGERVPAAFQIQSLPGMDDPIMSAPSIPEQRPTDVPTTQNVATR